MVAAAREAVKSEPAPPRTSHGALRALRGSRTVGTWRADERAALLETTVLRSLSALGHAAPRTLRVLSHQAEAVGKLGVRRLRRKKSPFQVTFSLTNRCNFKCEYCEIPLQRRDEMSADEFCDAIDQLRAAGMGRASLIGGEPLLRKDVGQIIAHLGRRGVHAAMNSNGWLVRDRLEDVRKLDLVCITLDGPRELHDKQRKKGSYDKALDAIEVLRGAGVPVVTMTVITPEGADRVDHVLDIAQRFDIQSFFQLEHDGDCDVDKPIAIRMSRASIDGVAKRLKQLKEDGLPVGNSHALLDKHIGGERYLGGCDGCYAGQYYAYVLSDGTIAPCLLTQWQQEAGNGRTHGFAKAFQDMAPPVGPGCSCVPTHEVNRVLSFDVSALFNALELAIRG